MNFNFFRTTMENDGSGENTDELLSAGQNNWYSHSCLYCVYCSTKCCISLFFSDVDEGVDVYGLIPVALSHDHCDVLLDAIDAQLSHLQVKHLYSDEILITVVY